MKQIQPRAFTVLPSIVTFWLKDQLRLSLNSRWDACVLQCLPGGFVLAPIRLTIRYCAFLFPIQVLAECFPDSGTC